MSEILKVEHIEKYYGNKDNITKAIDDISFVVQNGEFIGIMGERGRQTPCEILRPHGHKSHIHVPTVIDHVALINIRCQNAIFEGHILGRNQIGRFLIIIGKVSAHPVLKQRPS